MKYRIMALAASAVAGSTAHAQLLFDNGTYITQTGAGALGADISRIQPRFNSFGSTCSTNTAPDFYLADDFIVPNGQRWTPTSTEWFAYQTNWTTYQTNSGIVAASVAIYNGNPGAGGTLVFGDFTTNRLLTSVWANAFRLTETETATGTARPVMKNTIDLTGCPPLEAGHYWVAITLTHDGTVASGPFCPPVVPTRPATDNAIQFNATTALWAPASGNGGIIESGGNQDYPFKLNGTSEASANSTPPHGFQQTPPLNIRQGRNVLVAVKVTGGSNPPSNLITVTADLTEIGGSATQNLNDAGTNGDAAAGDGTYSYLQAVDGTVPLGIRTCPVTINDDSARSSSFQLKYVVHTISQEIEPCELKYASNPIFVDSGGTITGTCNSTATVADSDYFQVLTGPVNGIMRHRLTISDIAVGHSILSAGQAAGVVQNTSIVFQTASTANGMIQWYTHGGDPNPYMYVRVLGTTAQLVRPYTLTLQSDPVTPEVIAGGDFAAGDISIDFNNQGHTANTEVWVYDSNFAPIQLWGNDNRPADVSGDPPASNQSFLRRTFAAGTYYLAVSNSNTSNNSPNPVDDGSRTLSVMDSGAATANSSATLIANMQFAITDSGGTPRVIASAKTEPFQVLWYQMTVAPSGPVACNAADIATAGNPDPQAGPDNFLTGDDFDLFISAFFNELRRTSDNSLIADMVDGDGNPPPDGFLTGSDFDYFLAKFFEGC